MCVHNQAFCQNAMMVLISSVQLFITHSYVIRPNNLHCVSEGSGNITVTVYLIGGTVSGDEVVTVSTEPGGTATGGIIPICLQVHQSLHCIDYLSLFTRGKYTCSWMFV